jgi:hypothetical protein
VVCDYVVSEKHAAPVFRVEMESASTSLQDVSNHISDYIISQPRRLQVESPKFEVFLAVTMKMTIFWDGVPWSMVQCYQHFR